MPKKIDGLTITECSCGHSAKNMSTKISEKNTKVEKEVEIIEKREETLPTSKDDCPKCGNDEAYYFVRQTRAADEPPTKFLRCTKCNHSWRDYD